MILSDITILASTILFFAVTIILVVVLLIAKKYLVPSGNVKITINDKTDVEVPTGDSLLSTLASQKIYLPSACGGGGSCGQCRVRIPEGGGEALPTEKVHFSRKASWLSSEGQKRHETHCPRISTRSQGMGMRGNIQQECCHIYQRIHRCLAKRRAYGFLARLLRTNQDS